MPPAPSTSRYHALLIGVAGYRAIKPLSGPSHDVAQMEGFLRSVLGPSLVLRKLVAPPEPEPPPALSELPTHQNIMQALEQLTGDAVAPGERVLIYFAGHGTSTFLPDSGGYHEALLPYDIEAGGAALLDVTFGELLDRIHARSGDLTVILDACCSAGATRSVFAASKATARTVALSRAATQGGRGPIPSAATVQHGAVTIRNRTWHGSRVSKGYSVVTACQTSQMAREQRFDNEQPPACFGIFTHALLGLLRSYSHEELCELAWQDIWSRLSATVSFAAAQADGEQVPQLLGPRENRILGGPSKRPLLGIPVHPIDRGRFAVDAGELAGLSPGAKLALYQAPLESLPALGSDAEQALPKLGMLTIESTTSWGSVAVPSPGMGPCVVANQGYGRLIESAPTQRLRVRLSCTIASEIKVLLAKHAAEDSVTYVAEEELFEACVGSYPDGSLWLGDDVYGSGLGAKEPGPLVRVPCVRRVTGPIDFDKMTAALRTALRHYAHKYVLPLRLTRHSTLALAQPQLQLRIVPCADARSLQRLQTELDSFPAREPGALGRVLVQSEEGIAIQIENQSTESLHFLLLCCAASGSVQLLGEDSECFVQAGSIKVLGQLSDSGYQPFRCGAPNNLSWCVDRLILLASGERTVTERLRQLESTTSFQEEVDAILYPERRLRGGPSDKQSKAIPLPWVSMVPLQVVSGQ